VVADLENDGLTVDSLLGLIADGRVASDDEALEELQDHELAELAPPAASVTPTEPTDPTEGGRR
jgi:monosaccharide-transporting ATPase